MEHLLLLISLSMREAVASGALNNYGPDIHAVEKIKDECRYVRPKPKKGEVLFEYNCSDQNGGYWEGYIVQFKPWSVPKSKVEPEVEGPGQSDVVEGLDEALYSEPVIETLVEGLDE